MSGVDHAERRQRIAAVAADVIAREGLDAATVRRIAAAVGYSTTIVTHYFASKDRLLMQAYRFVAQQASERFDQVVAQDPGDIVGSLLSMTAADDSSRRGWRVYIAFWQKAGPDPAFAAEQRRWIEVALDRIEQVLRVRHGERADLKSVAQWLNALVQGISVQALFDEASWSPEQIREVLQRQVRMLLGPARDA